ncbi:NAD(P)H-dependent flavin oxidoreductase [Levilactobacillus fujinensis]|uniref:Probable nitronate monooxygenase n=1 Tax=Levilactobacillus fujinensis TaxID=2486024 RepID=A0ABW1TH01_9LACO|nr:nitronate monooxygenase [Levilactobacillus fujinensis]
MKSLQETLHIKYPIISGPMAWTSMAPLVGAVSNAGGFGVLGVGFSPSEVVAHEIEATQQLTDKPFAINVTIFPEVEENLERVTAIAAREGVGYIYADNGAGLERDFTQKWFDKWHALGMTVLTKVMTSNEAQVADDCGADVIIAKGWEGGGHISLEGTMALLPQVMDVVKHALVVASGGIADGRGYAAARMFGCAGIEMGTRFMAATEGSTHENVKRAVVAAQDGDVVMTGASTGAPCWQLKNQLSDQMAAIERADKPSVAAEKLQTIAVSSLRQASEKGNVTDRGAVMAGQVVPLVKQVEPVAQILEETYRDGIRILRQTADLPECQVKA